MCEGLLGTKVVTQIGFIVRDMDKTKKKFAEFLGVEEPDAFWSEGIEKTQSEFNGKPCPARARLAFFKVGDTLDIELIQPDEQPSVWRNFLDENGEGVHHIAFQVKGMKEKVALLEKAGMPLIQKGEYTGGRYAYMNSTGDLKVLLELLEND